MNTIKTTFLLTAMTLLLLFIGGALAGRGGLVLAMIVAILMNGGAYFFSDKIALKSSRRSPYFPGRVPAALCSDGAAGRKSQLAHAEAVPGAAASAERFCDGPESEPRVRSRHAGPDGIDERRRTRRRDRTRAFARSQLRHSHFVHRRHARRCDHLDCPIRTLRHDVRRQWTAAAAVAIMAAPSWRCSCYFWPRSAQCSCSWGFREAVSIKPMPLASRWSAMPTADQRPRKTRRLQPAHPEQHSTDHGGPVHRATDGGEAVLLGAIQHAPSALGPDRGSPQHDHRPEPLIPRPLRRFAVLSASITALGTTGEPCQAYHAEMLT